MFYLRNFFWPAKLWGSKTTRKCFLVIQAPRLTPWIKSAEYESTNILTLRVWKPSFDFKRFVKINVTEAGGSLFSVQSSSTVEARWEAVVIYSSPGYPHASNWPPFLCLILYLTYLRYDSFRADHNVGCIWSYGYFQRFQLISFSYCALHKYVFVFYHRKHLVIGSLKQFHGLE